VLPFFISPVQDLLKPEQTRPPLLLAGALPWLTGINFVLLAVAVAVTAHCTIALPPAIGFCLYWLNLLLSHRQLMWLLPSFPVDGPKPEAQSDSALTAVCCALPSLPDDC